MKKGFIIPTKLWMAFIAGMIAAAIQSGIEAAKREEEIKKLKKDINFWRSIHNNPKSLNLK